MVDLEPESVAGRTLEARGPRAGALGKPAGPAPGRSLGRWFRRGEPLALGFRAATVITRGIPGPLRYRLADVGGGAAFTMFSGRARVARENYLVFRPGDPRAVHDLARAAYRNYARTVMDFLVLERLLERLKSSPGAVEMASLERALAAGQSVIVVTPHLGNWDLGAAIIASAGRPVYAVADQFGPPAVDSLVRAKRERLGVRVIPTGPASAREALRALRRGDVLCLAADIDKAGNGIPVNFLGRRVCLPAGPATLALRTGASLIPGYALRRGSRGHEARLFEPIELPGDGDADARVRVVTQRIADAFERMIQLDPSQWFAFHHQLSGRPFAAEVGQ